jgi:membrane protein implicated in regulation of membrane protease activity
MIALIGIIVGLFFLLCLTFGVRKRQPLAIVAAFLGLATLYCWWGFLTAAMLTGSRLVALIWFAAGTLSLILAGVLAFIAWRRASQAERANPGAHRSRMP